MLRRKNGPPNEIEQDAEEAEKLGPTSAPRTPPWVWAWMLPVLLLVFLWMIRSILGPFVIAGVLAYIFSMVVDRLQERLRWPRALTVSILYLLVLSAYRVDVVLWCRDYLPADARLCSGRVKHHRARPEADYGRPELHIRGR